MMAELSSGSRDHLACKARPVWYLALYQQKSVYIPDLECEREVAAFTPPPGL